MNGRDGVSEATRLRIMDIVKEQGYRPNLLARGNRSRTSNLIGVVVGDIERRFFIDFLHGAEEEARERSFAVLVGNACRMQ